MQVLDQALGSHNVGWCAPRRSVVIPNAKSLNKANSQVQLLSNRIGWGDGGSCPRFHVHEIRSPSSLAGVRVRLAPYGVQQWVIHVLSSYLRLRLVLRCAAVGNSCA